MLPACRTEGDGFAIPQFALDPGDVTGLMDELHGFHTAFRDCFARSEPRDHFFHYMVGQFSALDRKSIEPIALQVEGGNVRAMQRGISDAVWDDAQMLRTYHRLVEEDMGAPEGVVTLQRYLTRYPAHSPGSVRQKGAVVALLDPGYQVEDVRNRQGF
jgi:hypothetical protein